MTDERGLSKSEVKQRKKDGLINGNFSVKTKSVGQIIFTNVFTLFNLVNIILALCLIMVQSYKNIMFLGVVFWNIIIGVVQEVRSKRVIDKLSLLSAPRASVIRDGEEQEIAVEEIVLDDIIMLRSGNQICVDSVVISGECDVNESLLTGESDPVTKRVGDELLSGSFLISGTVTSKATHVGKDNYVNQITSQAKYLKRPNSQIMKSIKLIIKGVSCVLIPIGALLFLNQYENQGFSEAVVSAVAGVLGMIPSGLVLLTSMVLAVSVVKLGQRKTLVQELYCIETLARVDVLCLDKTGTITEGTMSVEKVISLDAEKKSGIGIEEALYRFTENLDDDNPTFDALWHYAQEGLDEKGIIGSERRKKFDEVRQAIPFSSDKKWSLVDFENKGCFVLGALEFVFANPDKELKDMADVYANQGQRVLVFAYSKEHTIDKSKPQELVPIGLVVFSDTIRKEAGETFKYFTNQGVNIKVISGDNPLTVSYVAKKAGVPNAQNYIDASTLKGEDDVWDAAEKYTVFGRVTPEQKLMLVKALKAKKHTVAMTGDGVNDVMALKEADCSIAMQSGSDAARNVSQLVLLDSNFASMPAVVAEGRRTINNLQRSASLYVTKTIYSIILGIMFVLLPLSYPFIPIQMTFIGALAIGIPSFILALEPNLNRLKGHFMVNVLKMAIPGGALVVTNVVVCILFKIVFKVSNDVFSTLCVFGLSMAALLQLIKCCRPFNVLRQVMCAVLIGAYAVGIIFFNELLGIERIKLFETIFVLILIPFSGMMYLIYSYLVGKLMGSAPNVYSLNIIHSCGERIVLVDDDVDKKDYFDVEAQIMGLKVLKADKVAFVKKAEKDGDIRVENAEGANDESVVMAAARIYRKNNVKTAKKIECIKVENVEKTQMVTSESFKKAKFIKKFRITF